MRVTPSDSTIIAMLIPALDGPNTPDRTHWAKTFSRTPEEIDALFDLANHERDLWGAELAALKRRPEAEAA